MMRVLLSSAWLPSVIVIVTVYGAVTGSDIVSGLCIGILAALACLFWIATNLLARTGDVAWRRLAEDATRGLVVSSAFTEDVQQVAADAMRALSTYDEQGAEVLRERYNDALARYTEHV
jgi:hypothetical protein